MRKQYILIILLMTCFLFIACNKKQVNNENTNQKVVEEKKETINTASNDSQKEAANDDSSNISNKQITYNSYTNPRYGFLIEYPNTFKKGEESDNGDGIVLSSSEDSAKLTVYGSNNILNETAQSALNAILKEHPDAPYKQREENWFVASWIEGDKIVYYKSVVGAGSSNTFILEYPANKKEFYDPVITRINSSFKTSAISSGH